MTVLNTNDALILIIDIQEKLLNATFNKDIVKNKSEIFAKTANILEMPCIITEQYPKGLGRTIPEITNNLSDKQLNYFEKAEFNALKDIELLNLLKKSNRQQVVLVGIETHICVRQTAEALIHEGFEVSIVKDICGSRAEEEHLAGLDIMKQEGCFIKTTEMILFELLKSAKHPKFKEIQMLIK